MIFVITGTEKFPMDKMVKKIDFLLKQGVLREKVFIQLGHCTYEPQLCSWERFLSFDEMCNNIQNADTIIAHAGAGTTLLCIQLGHHPILIPRRKEYGEHVDDHQLSFAKKFETTGFVTVVYDIESITGDSIQSTKNNSIFRFSDSKKLLVDYLNNIVQ